MEDLEVTKIQAQIVNKFIEKFQTEYGEVEKSEEGIYTSPTKIEMLLLPEDSETNESIRRKSEGLLRGGFCFEAKRIYKLLSVLVSSGVDLGDVILEVPIKDNPLRIRNHKGYFHLILAPLVSEESGNQSLASKEKEE